MFARALATAILISMWGWLSWGASVAAPLISGPAAGLQFQPSDSAYLTAQLHMLANGALPWWVSLIFFALLAGLWWRPARAIIAKAGALAILCLVLAAVPAQAYFDTTDKTEAYTILPNESAFWIPDVGDNKSSQAKMDSEQYLNEKKVPTKRFIIPHQKLSGTGGTCALCGWDSYVPTGRLIIVDRTPFSREWVAAAHRGSSPKDESFPCQSKEGLNISVGVSIGASVTEDNAATFLYHFGVVSPKGNRNDPAIIFTSVYYGRSLADVMDDVARKKVQTLVCNQIAQRTFDAANADAVAIMTQVEKDAKTWLAGVGISLDFIGYADTFIFDKDVQLAVNDRYSAEKIAPVLGILQTKAFLDAIGQKWDGHAPNMPGFVIIPGNFFDKVADWFGTAVKPAKP